MPSPNDAWIEYASADLDAADRLLKSPHPNSWTFLLAAWHCHQAIEKMLKRIMVAREKEVIKIHDLGKLYSLAGTTLESEQLAFVEKMNQYYMPSRYPDFLYKPFPKLSLENATSIFDRTTDVFVCLKNQS